MSDRFGSETIYALSSAGGKAAVAVVRLSGPGAAAAILALTGRAPGPARVADLRALRDPADGGVLDRALILWFAGPYSVTGEDVAEFQVHGGPAVVEGVLAALGRLPGMRLAAPGEFTRRAFDHGKLDLTEVEGLADLIDAETAGQRRQALRQMGGALGRLYESWRQALIGMLAYVEAELDFPDEDLPGGLAARIAPGLTRLIGEIASHLADGGRGERLRSGIEVVILGPPNVGKSSLLNRLVGREAAIVSAQAGTTRDVIEVRLDLGGVPVTVADTAGLRAAASEVEQEGINRALARAAQADFRIWMRAMTETGADDMAAAGTGSGREDAGEKDVRVVNKVDLAPDLGASGGSGGAGFTLMPGEIALSAIRGDGIDELVELLTTRVTGRYGMSEAPLITRARHRDGLEACLDRLKAAADLLRGSGTGKDVSGAAELVAEDLRLAARALGRITGRVDVDDVLDVIFKDFCIGK